MVYNVHGFRDGYGRLVRLVGHLQPDLLLVNESGARRRLRRFARHLGMLVAADPWSPLRRRIKNAVLARPPWRIAAHRLHRFAGAPGAFPRGALIARIEGPEARLWAISVHLGLHPGERRRHADDLVGLADGLGGPVLIGGDLNERPDGRAVSLLRDRFGDAWSLAGDGPGETYPADEPVARIDYLLVSEGVAVERILVPPGPDAREASDHRPLVAELQLGG
jgi:endonuclease/exonuclease/phosphatase family metal-dependent hydrolase